MDLPDCYGSPRKSPVRSCLCKSVPVHNRTVSHSGSVSQAPRLCCAQGHTCRSKGLPDCSYRQNGLGFSSFVAWVGVSMSPLVMLLEDVWQLLPHIVYCAVAVGSGLLILLLPETLNTRLPELIEDIEKPT